MNTIKSEKRWCLWKFELGKDNRLTKVPYQIIHTRAKSNNPKTWATFEQVSAVYEENREVYNGIGLFFSDGLCGIDVDGNHKADSKARNPLETEVLAMFAGTYQETSPSGNGDHILFRVDPARVPHFDSSAEFKRHFYMKNPHNDLEFYAGDLTKRFFTFTGNRISTGDVVTDQTDALLVFLEKHMTRKRKTTTQKGAPLPSIVSDFADGELDADVFIANRLNLAGKAKNGAKFVKLYTQGDISDYNNDDSAADQALCAMLAWWLNGDRDLIDRAFRGSALYRDKWERDDYRESTIEKGISYCSEFYQEPHTGARPGRPSKPRLSLDGLATILEQTGFSVRLNVITGEYVTDGQTPSGRRGNDISLDDMTTLFYDLLADEYKNVSMHLLEQYIVYLGREHQFNPVLEFLQTLTWDGVDRIQQLYDLLYITDDELSKTLVYKWLLQTVALLFNGENRQDPFGADGCLTLKGGQGWSKTSFFRRLGLRQQWFGEGQKINSFDKDTRRRVITKWISELGEVETTLKSDIEDLKNFISVPTDEYRLPYGRSDINRPRRASLCATCNSDEFLIDVTGNRRWWTVPITHRVEYDDVQAFDAEQLWAQIYAIVAPLPYNQKKSCFRLTPAERDQLAIRNGRFEKPVKGQEEVADILARADREMLEWKEMTVSDFKGYWPELRVYTVQQLGTALKRCGLIKEERKSDNRFKLLPVPKMYSE